jgi:tetratricopeptide (TPR) repeat protein
MTPRSIEKPGFIQRFIHYLSLEKNASPHTCRCYRKDLEGFEDFLKTQPDSPLADQAWFELGDIHQQLEQPGPAMEAFENLLVHRPQSPLVVEARLRLAELKIAAGRFEEARAVLGSLPSRPAQPRQETRALLLSGRAFLGDKRRLEALERDTKSQQKTR